MLDLKQLRAYYAAPSVADSAVGRDVTALLDECERLRDACSFALRRCVEAFNGGDFEETCDAVVGRMDTALNTRNALASSPAPVAAETRCDCHITNERSEHLPHCALAPPVASKEQK